MFINPVDRDTINAMVRYHRDQVQTSHQHSLPAEQSLVVVRPAVSSRGFIGTVRQSVGLALIRAGARLAGFGLQSRIGTQS